MQLAPQNKNINVIQHGKVYLKTQDYIKVVTPQKLHAQVQNVFMSTGFMKFWLHLLLSKLGKMEINNYKQVCFIDSIETNTVERVTNFITLPEKTRLINVEPQNSRLFKAFEVDKRNSTSVSVKFFDTSGMEKNTFKKVIQEWFAGFNSVDTSIGEEQDLTLDIEIDRDQLCHSDQGTKSYDGGACGIYICYFILSLLTNENVSINDEILWKCRIHLGLMCLSGEVIYE